jgi:hypothetical protein
MLKATNQAANNQVPSTSPVVTKPTNYTTQTNSTPSPTARPQVEPVYGICGHIARSPRHTCGAWFCLQMWGW